MEENNKNQLINKESIKTNYNFRYKQRIKRVNSKPNISRTKYLINYENNNNENKNDLYNLINKEKESQNYNNKFFYKDYSTYNPSEESSYSTYKGSEYSTNLKRNDYYPTKRVIDSNYQEPPIYKKQLNNYNTPKDDWAEMLYHPTQNKNLAKKIINSKTFQSNIFPISDAPTDKIRHSKETRYSDRLHKTQITTLPGCIKRGKNDIKDDNYLGMRNTDSYLYKVEHDFNSNVYFGPMTKEEEKVEINFPVEQRYHGSYQRGVKDNDIFNLNNEEEVPNAIVSRKKLFRNNNTFKSQIVFI